MSWLMYLKSDEKINKSNFVLCIDVSFSVHNKYGWVAHWTFIIYALLQFAKKLLPTYLHIL